MPTDHHDEAATISDENAFWEESQLDGQAFDEQEMTPVMPMEGADEGGASPSRYQSMEGANAGFGVTAAEYSRYLLHGGPLPEGLPGGKFQRSGWFLLEPGDGAEWNRVMGLPADSLLMFYEGSSLEANPPPPGFVAGADTMGDRIEERWIDMKTGDVGLLAGLPWYIAAHDPEFKLVEHRTKNKKKNNKKKKR